MTIKTTKFFDIATEEPATQLQEQAAPSVASLMAKHAVINNTSEPIAQPIDAIPEKKEETKEPESATPAATATEPEKVVETKTESPATKEQEPVVETKKEEQPQAKVQTWQEVLKEQPNAVFKELGFDDKVVQLANELNGFENLDYFLGLVKEWKQTGSIGKYAQELSTDYNKMPAEDVMRHQLRQEYPKATEKQLDVLFRKEVVEKYNLLSEDEVEKEEGTELMNVMADKYRDTFIEKQKNYLTPAPPAAKQPEKPDNTAQIERQNEISRIYKTLSDSEFAKSIKDNKAFNFGEGDGKFTFPVDMDRVLNVLDKGDPEVDFTNIQKNDDGSFKTGDLKPENTILSAIVRIHGLDFINALANHFKSHGGKKVTDSIENASGKEIPSEASKETQPKSIAEHMAKSGRISNPYGG